jgi:hypothetical protein
MLNMFLAPCGTSAYVDDAALSNVDLVAQFDDSVLHLPDGTHRSDEPVSNTT